MTPLPITDIRQLDPHATYSYADYLTWQFTELVELIRGKIARRMSAPTDQHQVVVGELYRRLANLLYRQPCQVRTAPYDVRLVKLGTPTHPADAAVHTVVQPDVCVICDPTKIEKRGCLGAPDLIIEVTSPGTATRDWKDKFDLYEENGVGEYWIVDPAGQSLSVFVLVADTADTADTADAAAHYRLVGEYAGPGPVPCHTLPALGLEWTDLFTAD